jgi:hypothetical protein
MEENMYNNSRSSSIEQINKISIEPVLSSKVKKGKMKMKNGNKNMSSF